MTQATPINSGYLYAIISAVLLGASTPAAKYFLGEIHPVLLAGLFYLGSGLGVLIILSVRHLISSHIAESNLKRSDWKWLLIAILCGGIMAPAMLMVGLTRTNAATASLLLNFESVFTALTAWLLFKEHTSRHIIFGMALIISGGFILGWSKSFNVGLVAGMLFIIAACFLWALDNNVTRNISATDPLKIVCIKSLVAGITNTTLAFAIGATLPNHMLLGMTTFVGFVGYGISLVCFILALRHIGTGRTGAYFSLAPFIGASLAVLFLGEPLTIQLVLAGCLMGWGTWLHLTEYHSHEHLHDELTHDHRHVHDEHHQHEHQPGDPKGEPHSHSHTHERLIHSHPHFPDTHHRHKH